MCCVYHSASNLPCLYPTCSTNCPALNYGVVVKLRLEVVTSWAQLVAKLLSWVRLLRNKGSEVFWVAMRIGRNWQTEINPCITCPSFITNCIELHHTSPSCCAANSRGVVSPKKTGVKQTLEAKKSRFVGNFAEGTEIRDPTLMKLIRSWAKVEALI